MKNLRLNPRLLKVPLYVAGKSAEQVREELGLDDIVKLASNENPLGPSPMAVAALQAHLGEAHRYPGIAERELRRRLATVHGTRFTSEHFIIGSGGTDVLRMVAQAFLFEGGQSVMGRVTFPLYRLLTTMYGGTSIVLEPTHGYALDLPAIAEAVRPETRLVWLCTPNNPTGSIIEQRQADALLDQLPDHVVVVLDESYCDYVTDQSAVQSTRYVLDGRPVVVVRSFSKSAGLANLRVGYGIAHPELIEYLRHAVLPFNTGALVIQAALASLEDHEYLRRSRELIVEQRTVLAAGLAEMGLEAHPSQANFVFVTDVPGGGQAFADRLLRAGVIVRPAAGFGEPNAVRVTVGRPEQNERLLAAVLEALDPVHGG